MPASHVPLPLGTGPGPWATLQLPHPQGTRVMSKAASICPLPVSYRFLTRDPELPLPTSSSVLLGGIRRGKAAVRGRPQACFASFTSHNLHLAFVSSGTQLLSSPQSLREQGELRAVPPTNTGSQGSAAHGDPL